MAHKRKKMMKRLSAAFSAAFIFISIFANCFHAHPLEKRLPGKSCFHCEGQSAKIISHSNIRKDCEGDCAACSFLSSAQGAYFDNVNLPEKQVSAQYSAAQENCFHNNILIEYLPRAPPYFIV